MTDAEIDAEVQSFFRGNALCTFSEGNFRLILQECVRRTRQNYFRSMQAANNLAADGVDVYSELIKAENERMNV